MIRYLRHHENVVVLAKILEGPNPTIWVNGDAPCASMKSSLVKIIVLRWQASRPKQEYRSSTLLGSPGLATALIHWIAEQK